MTTRAINRRTFLKASGAVVGLTAAGHAPAFAQGTKAEDAVKWAEGELKKIYEG